MSWTRGSESRSNKQVQKKITDSADHLWIDHETTLVAMNKRIGNFKIHPQIHYFWSVDAN